MKFKVLIISILTLVLTLTCLIINCSTANAMVLYDSWDDLNGKQFYIEFENFKNENTFVAYSSAIELRNNYFKDSKNFGKVEIYDENDSLLGTVDKIKYYEFGLSQKYKLFNYSYHGDAQKECLSLYDSDYNLHQFFDVDYLIWTIPENAFAWEQELGQSPESHCGSNDWNDLYGDISLVTRYLSEDGLYSFENGYIEGKTDGYKEGQVDGYNVGISTNISDNAEKIFVNYEGKTETETALKVLIAVTSVFVVMSVVVLLLLKFKGNKSKVNKIKVNKKRRKFRR